MERLQTAGLKVGPVTAAPAGWCDQMARMWPIDGVIGENGGLFFRRAAGEHGVAREFWHGEKKRREIADRLAAIARKIVAASPSAVLADDQPFRLASLASPISNSEVERRAIVAAPRKAIAHVTLNNLWILVWIGGYDKLAMAWRVMADHYGLDIEADRDAVMYCSDSTNDAPMFGHFGDTVGVSTVRRYLSQIPVSPRWITQGPGGDGFVEAANAVIASRA
jgi:3-deoxy-D-manno-octulosonate 8-phosphate phosphatase KdsC-like HAD superfamily phosphatase